jgi:RES domain
VTKLPDPPAPRALSAVAPDRRTFAAGHRLWRIYFRSGAHPTAWNALRAWGPSSARFDHHLPPPRIQDRTVLYAAENGATCVAEVFQDTRTIDRRRREPWLVAFDLAEPVELLDLTGPWPTRAGASMAINSGPRPRARRWSQVIYAAYPHIQGLLYASSMDANRPAVVLYDRATRALPARPAFHRALADPALIPALVRAAERFAYALV